MIKRLLCPVDDCGWSYDDHPRDLETLVDNLGLDVLRTHAILTRRENALRAHLESHDVLDWARTVGRLQEEAARKDSLIDQLRGFASLIL